MGPKGAAPEGSLAAPSSGSGYNTGSAESSHAHVHGRKRPTLTLRRPREPEPVQEPGPAFWFIWAPDGRRPKKRHATLEAAQHEAARLRALMPKRVFPVFEARLITAKPAGGA
jgi:hypothetical protein